ncbi:MAG: type II secretion system protein GspD [Bryobacteraceae bacterium]
MRTGAAICALVLAGLSAAQDGRVGKDGRVGTDTDGPSAWELYEEGRAAEKSGHMAEAYLLYMEASAMQPQNKTYWLRGQAVQSRAAMEAKPAPNPSSDTAMAEPDTPAIHFDPPTAEDEREVRKLLPPTELAADPQTRDFDLRGDSKKLFEQVAHTYGLDCIFDSDYQPTKEFRFQLQAVDYRVAMHSLEAATGSFIIPLTGKLFMVAKDTPKNRTDLEPVEAVEIRLPETRTSQDFSGLIAAVQQSLGLEKVSWDTQNNTVIIRDKISKVVPAQALFQQLMHATAQVTIEMEFLTVSRDDTITYGVDLPSMLSLSPLTTWLNNAPSLSSGVAGLLSFGAGKTLIGIGIATPSMVAQMTKNSGKVLFSTELRALDGQPASLHLGQRYPILTSGYFGATGSAAAGTTAAGYVPTPSFSFEDLGLTLKVTPSLHDIEEVSLEIDASYKVLAGTSLNGIPVIGSQTLKSKPRLKLGEWAMVAGLLNSSDAYTISGLAGLSQIPHLGPLFSTHEKDKSTDEVLILLRPRLLSLPPSQSINPRIYLGSDTRPVTPL